jgi:glycosyltransferase involved in cell wall biosynthesis
MKVGVFIGRVPPVVGGGFTFADEILQALFRLESKHSIILFGDLPEDQRKKLAAKEIQVVSPWRYIPKMVLSTLMRNKSNFAANLPILREGLRVADWFQRSVCDLGVELMWFVTPFFIEVEVPFILTIWDIQHRLQPWFPEVSIGGEWFRREKFYSIAIRRAYAVIVGTEAGKAEIVSFYGIPPERVKLIPHPTPAFALCASRENREEVLTRYRLPEGYLFYPAQFWPHKNHVGLLLALAFLRENYGLKLPVVFVGSDKGNMKYVRQTAENLGLSSQVHFLGFVPRDDMIGLYRNAFALTFLTFFGPENLPPLEAFALGCPVLASNVPGAQEQLGDAALLVDPRNEREIAEGIKLLYEDSALREKLIGRGLKQATKWTGDDWVRSMFAVLDEFQAIRRCWGS